MKIQIKKCSDNMWYSNIIGKVLTVKPCRVAASYDHMSKGYQKQMLKYYYTIVWKNNKERTKAIEGTGGLMNIGRLLKDDCGLPSHKIKVRTIRLL